MGLLSSINFNHKLIRLVSFTNTCFVWMKYLSQQNKLEASFTVYYLVDGF